MNKVILPAFLCFLGFSSLAQVSNGDMEDWTKVILFEHPLTGITTMSSNYETFFANGELNVNRVNVEASNHAMRIENMQINDEVQPGYFLFGGQPMSDGETLVFADGFDFDDQNATGVSMDIKMDIPAEKPGIVVVQFKSQGVPVGIGNAGTGTYVFPISGNQDWTQMEFAFDGAIDPSTDQCVVGIASADLVNEDAPFNPTSYVEVDNVSMINAAEVPGGTFDIWLSVPPIFVPNDILVDVDVFNPTYVQATQASNGDLALGLNTIEKDGMVEAGSATMANTDEEGNIVPNITLDDSHTFISFMYNYHGILGDKAGATFVFYKESNGTYTEVYSHEMELPSNGGGYQYREYVFEEDLMEAEVEADYMTVTFTSSKNDGVNVAQSGSQLLVDQVALSNSLGLLSRAGKTTSVGVLSYPNPTMGRVEFNFGGHKSGYFRVYSPSGTLLDTRTYSSTHRASYDMTELPAGNYLFKFYHTSGYQSTRVMKL